MKRFSLIPVLSAVLGICLAVCNSTTPNSTSSPTSAQSGDSEMGMMKTELSELSPEDAASAEKQHVCPVSGEMLGTMGAPEKVDVNGQQVWICCDNCKDKLLANPEEYLAKLKKE